MPRHKSFSIDDAVGVVTGAVPAAQLCCRCPVLSDQFLVALDNRHKHDQCAAYVHPLTLMSVRFLNVDLEIESALSLEPIVDAFQASGLHCLAHIQTKRGRLASFEIADCPTDANDVVSAFCDVIERLGADARAVWESATVRRFDLGFRSDGSGPLFRSELKEMTLGRLAKLGATVALSIYPSPRRL